MKDPKTTLTGVVTALGVALPLFGIPVTPEVTNGIIAVGIFFIGLFAHDSKPKL